MYNSSVRKRIFDFCISIFLIFLFLPLLILICLWILWSDGRPIFFISKRMKTSTKSFEIFKFRTMKLGANDGNATGGNKNRLISRSGFLLRKYRLDELPQLFNIIKGDMSFVGPRPPLEKYVIMFPKIYNEVLKSKPGVTGLASIYMSDYEAKVLNNVDNPREVEEKYISCCLKKKATLDLAYQKSASMCFDVYLMLATLAKSLR